MTELTERGKRFRETITTFINERREAKLKGKEDDADTASKYDYATWLADAARRVTQIQAVTHVLKATHPDARGSSLHVRPASLPQHAEIGSHLLSETFAEDVVGNAAALDVFKLLKLEVDGQRLLDWMQRGDADLLSALHDNADTANEWAAAFAGLVRQGGHATSHEKAKQLYWLTGEHPADNSYYHLLQPLFSSSLAHAIHGEIQDARFGEMNKQARQARRNHEPCNGEYRDFRGLVTRKLGGTKPQNISQLNSERGGINYLLASLPPHWQGKNEIKLRGKSALDAFLGFGSVRQLVKQLSDLLLANPDPTMKTRQTREAIEQALGAQLAAFGETIQKQQAPGWTRTDCELDINEQLWLDPQRTELSLRTDDEARQDDDAFNTSYAWGDWPDEIAGRFANWLNARLREAGLVTVGESEAKHWAQQAIIDVAWPISLQRRKGAEA